MMTMAQAIQNTGSGQELRLRRIMGSMNARNVLMIIQMNMPLSGFCM